ncbi:hypothetical protein J6590_079727 [Homalodisca vitripennis]|nr:hypothetical protein J6590_079727 [Homalodisca vitripennis]
MYKIHVNESEEVIKEILKRSSPGSFKQRKEINQELNTIRERIVKQEGEITKYKNSLRKIKDRSFLKEWYWELVDKVKGEVKRKNDHILHKDFSENQREEVFTIRLQNQFILEVVSRILKEIVGDRCSKEQLDYLKDIMMDQLIDNSKLNYQSLVEGIKCALKEKVNEHNGQSREIFELVINEIKPDKFMKAEQSVLDDMLLEAVTQGKQDSALLLICNGANINLEKEDKTKIKVRKRLDEEILKKPGFLVIRKLYGEMPSIKASLCLNLDIQTFSEFVVEGFSQSVKENYQEFKVEDIFTLAEIKEIFPDNTVVKEAADSLAECDKDKLIIKEQVMQKEKVLCELQKKFNSKKEEYTRPSWKWVALAPIVVMPWYSLAYAALYVGACLAYTVVDVGRPWNARRNAKNELEIAQEDLNRAIEMFEVFLEYLQCSVVAGSDIFNKRCEEIKVEIANIKKSKEKWVNLSSVLSAFENVQKVSEVSGKSEFCFNTESIKFNELAGNIISNRMRYMDKLSQPDQPFKSTGQTIVAEDNVKQREEREKRKKAEVEAREERKAKEEAQAKLEEGRRAKEEVEAKLEEERKAKEEERKAKEEERKAKEKAQTRNEAYGSLLLQIRSGELPLSALQEMDIESLVAGPSWRK